MRLRASARTTATARLGERSFVLTRNAANAYAIGRSRSWDRGVIRSAKSEGDIIIGEFFSSQKKLHPGIFFNNEKALPGNKVLNRQITDATDHRDLLRAGSGDKGDAHKGHSHFVAACQRYCQRFRQLARRFVHPMRSKESALVGPVHAGWLVIKSNKAALDLNVQRCHGLE